MAAAGADITDDLHVGAAPQAGVANEDADLLALEALDATPAPAEPAGEVVAPSAEALANPPQELEVEEEPAAAAAAADDDFLIDLEPLAVPEPAANLTCMPGLSVPSTTRMLGMAPRYLS